MSVKAVVRFADEFAKNRFSLPPDLSPAISTIAMRLGSNAKATRQTPSVASNRISFMLAWRESLSVSTRGLPSWGPICSSRLEIAAISSRTSTGKEKNSESNSSLSRTSHAILNTSQRISCQRYHNALHCVSKRLTMFYEYAKSGNTVTSCHPEQREGSAFCSCRDILMPCQPKS
jgi:hypothetical protein